MNKLFHRLLRQPLDERLTPLFLLALAVLAYGLLFAFQGFYWDDFPLAWIDRTFGADGLERYFSTNRPFWGLLYQASAELLGGQPWQWQIFGLVWRWASAVMLWLAVRAVWPGHKKAAVWAAALCLVYPGFGQQAIGRVYGHFFLVLTAFFFSLYASLRALRALRAQRAQRGPAAWLWTLAGLAASFVNLITLEYFFLLELIRPLLLYFAVRHGEPRPLRRAALAWLPYLLVLIGVGIWRAFFFTFQTNNYEPVLLNQLQSDPLAALGGLLAQAFLQTLTAGLAAWGLPWLRLPDFGTLGLLNLGLYLAALLGGLALGLRFLLPLAPPPEDAAGPSAPNPAGEMILTGAAALVLAGAPFYLTGLPVALGFPNDRFTLPFLLGTSLLLAGLLSLIPRRAWIPGLLAAVLVGLSTGYHFLNATEYRRDWNLQKSFFWQLTWRAPGLLPGTTLMTNDLPVQFYSDNSLTAPLNWIYAPENRTTRMDYILFYPTVREGLEELPSLQPGLTVEIDYLAATFSGSTDQVLAVVYEPPACLRVVDGVVETDNLFVAQYLREVAARLGSSRWITAQPQVPAAPPAGLYDPEPAHGWCYYFQKADLARQQKDWEAVASLGDQAFELGDYPNDPTERLPFVEGYAHVGRWERALELTRESAAVTPAMQPVLCRLWQRIAQQTAPDEGKAAALETARGELGCASFDLPLPVGP